MATVVRRTATIPALISCAALSACAAAPLPAPACAAEQPMPASSAEPSGVRFDLRDAELMQVLVAAAQAAGRTLLVDPKAQPIVERSRVSLVTATPVVRERVVALVQLAIAPAQLQVTETTDSWIVRLAGDAADSACPCPSTTPIPDPTPESLTPERLRGGIRKVSDTRYEVARYVVDGLLADSAGSGGARLVPSSRAGKVESIRVSAVQPAGIFALLGFQNGDEILSVMGLPMSSPEKALEAYAAARNAAVIPVTRRRGGKVSTIEYAIAP